MKIPKAISFDAAGTLVRVDYQPAKLALAALKQSGVAFDEQKMEEDYWRLLLGTRSQYEIVNRDGSLEDCRKYWIELTERWIEPIGSSSSLTLELVERVERRMFGENQDVFSLFEDTMPILDECDRRGLRLMVISNWDYTLDRALQVSGIFDRFEVIVASLRFGAEKPDPSIFHFGLGKMQLLPEDVWHVGDDPLADVVGANQVGMRGVLIDRSHSESSGHRIHDLRELFAKLDS